MRQDVTFHSETWKVLFTNILGSVGDVMNMQIQGLIPIIRRKYNRQKAAWSQALAGCFSLDIIKWQVKFNPVA